MKPPGHGDMIRSRDGHKHDTYARVDIKRQVENNSIPYILWGKRVDRQRTLLHRYPLSISNLGWDETRTDKDKYSEFDVM